MTCTKYRGVHKAGRWVWLTGIGWLFTIRGDDRHAVVKLFLIQRMGKAPEGIMLIFRDIWISHFFDKYSSASGALARRPEASGGMTPDSVYWLEVTWMQWLYRKNYCPKVSKYGKEESEWVVESHQFWPTSLAFGSPVGVMPFEFRRDLWHQKTTVPEVPFNIVCVILSLTVLIQYQRVTDRQTHRHRHTALCSKNWSRDCRNAHLREREREFYLPSNNQ